VLCFSQFIQTSIHPSYLFIKKEDNQFFNLEGCGENDQEEELGNSYIWDIFIFSMKLILAQENHKDDDTPIETISNLSFHFSSIRFVEDINSIILFSQVSVQFILSI